MYLDKLHNNKEFIFVIPRRIEGWAKFIF